MATHVALLRGINVGGSNKVPMAELRQVVAALGHQDVTTYIQSGNVLFSTRSPDTAVLASGLEQAIEQAFGIRAGVIVVSRAELARVISDNPYPDEPDPKAVHAVFLAAEPSAERKEAVAAAQRAAEAAGSRDTATHVGRVLYLHTPDGYGRSELAARLARSSGRLPPGEAGTARNWATVTKLLALSGG
jgi:uncharacterized protein (DUF1697 family)